MHLSVSPSAINKPKMWGVNAALAVPPGRSRERSSRERSSRERSMEATAAKLAQEKFVNPAALSTPERHMPQRPGPAASPALEKKLVGYGLPCSRCHAYYPADMHVCPICKSPDRVSPSESVKHSTAAAAPQPASQLTTSAPVNSNINTNIDDDRE